MTTEQVIRQALHDMSAPCYAEWDDAEAFLDALPTSYEVVEKRDMAQDLADLAAAGLRDRERTTTPTGKRLDTDLAYDSDPSDYLPGDYIKRYHDAIVAIEHEAAAAAQADADRLAEALREHIAANYTIEDTGYTYLTYTGSPNINRLRAALRQHEAPTDE